jgi:hypothetical protein
VVKVCAVIRDGLAQAGIDPAGAVSLRNGDAAAARLAELGDTPELERADAQLPASDDDPSAGIFAAKIGAMATRYGDAGPPNLATASLAELFAWCLARPAGRD